MQLGDMSITYFILRVIETWAYRKEHISVEYVCLCELDVLICAEMTASLFIRNTTDRMKGITL